MSGRPAEITNDAARIVAKRLREELRRYHGAGVESDKALAAAAVAALAGLMVDFVLAVAGEGEGDA